jgi:hypothetical protein
MRLRSQGPAEIDKALWDLAMAQDLAAAASMSALEVHQSSGDDDSEAEALWGLVMSKEGTPQGSQPEGSALSKRNRQHSKQKASTTSQATPAATAPYTATRASEKQRNKKERSGTPRGSQNPPPPAKGTNLFPIPEKGEVNEPQVDTTETPVDSAEPGAAAAASNKAAGHGADTAVTEMEGAEDEQERESSAPSALAKGEVNEPQVDTAQEPEPAQEPEAAKTAAAPAAAPAREPEAAKSAAELRASADVQDMAAKSAAKTADVAAQTSAGIADAKAGAAQTAASSSLTVANNANAKADTAQTSAATADAKAVAADAKAGAAQAVASSSQTVANNADAKANTAQLVANSADAKAGAAQGSANTADGKAVAAQLTADTAALAPAPAQLSQGLASKSVPCPVCKLLVECDDAATVNFAEAFGDKGTKRKGKDAKDSKDAKAAKLKGGSSRGPGSAKLGIAFRLHVSNFHLQEPVWNALPRMDLASADEPCSSKRTKNTNATLAGLVAYGLAYAGRRVPLLFDLADDWHKMRTLMILKVGYAVSEVGHAEVFFKGRTNVVGVPPSLHKQGDQRSWLKKMASEYLMRLSDAIMRASPSAVWLTESSPARKRNAHQIFFLSRGCHLDCPALIKYHSDDLTKTNILRVLDPLLESSASELATGDNDLTEAVVPVDPVALF